MGMAAQPASSDGEDGGYRPMAEINITPMVDVMLVLLIIFMVAAPMLTVGVPVELPKSAAGALPTEQEEPLTITLTRYGPRLFDPGNHEGSFKHVQDGVADFLGRDDGDPALTWQYEQAIGKDYAVRVRIEA